MEINSLMTETIKNQLQKQIFYEQKGEFGNNLFILENWNGLSCRESFSWKKDQWFIRITSFFKIWYEAIRKKGQVKIKFIKCIFFSIFFMEYNIVSFNM